MITIKYEDNADGTVKIISEPAANVLIERMKSGSSMTKAESMATMSLIDALAGSKRADREKAAIYLPDLKLIT